jgi:AcrR family transcriptional regulator
MRRRTGRRRGTTETRDAIAAAASRLFSELGYDRTSLRAIAAEAGVDAALISHFFGTKRKLFLAVVELPFKPSEVLPDLLSGDRESVGERAARFFVQLLEDPDARMRITGIIRAAASEPEAAAMLRELLSRELFGPIASILRVEDAELRATLVGSQISGLALARHVVGLEPLASTDADTLVAAIAPTLQRYLVEPLGLPR